MERGKIRNKAAIARIRDFSGLRYGKITPTDIDGFLEFGDEVFIIIEGKLVGARESYGQITAIQRTVNGLQNAGKHSLAIIAEHYDESHYSDDGIPYAELPVIKFWYNQKWHTFSGTVRELIDKFLGKYAPRFLSTTN